MIFTRVIATLFAFGTISALASPAPVVEKREDVSDVLAVISTLQSTYREMVIVHLHSFCRFAFSLGRSDGQNGRMEGMAACRSLEMPQRHIRSRCRGW